MATPRLPSSGRRRASRRSRLWRNVKDVFVIIGCCFAIVGMALLALFAILLRYSPYILCLAAAGWLYYHWH